jgi:hypothetical protein
MWVNPLFLWPFSIANSNKLPEGTSNILKDSLGFSA